MPDSGSALWDEIFSPWETGTNNALEAVLEAAVDELNFLPLRACLTDARALEASDAGGNRWCVHGTADGTALYFRVDHETGDALRPLLSHDAFQSLDPALLASEAAATEAAVQLSAQTLPEPTQTSFLDRWARTAALTLALNGEGDLTSKLELASASPASPGQMLHELLVAWVLSADDVLDALLARAGVSPRRIERDAAEWVSRLRAGAADLPGVQDASRLRADTRALRSAQRARADAAPSADAAAAMDAGIARFNCSDRGLGKLGAALLKYPGLVSLDASLNRLTTVGPEIAQCRRLQRLDLTEHRLTSLPPELGQLSELRELRLGGTFSGGTYLEQLPAELGNLAKLELLDLADCHLNELPEALCQLSRLKWLSLANNSLKALPERLGSLSALEYLDLSRAGMQALPDSLGELAHLRTLKLRRCLLHPLPEPLGRLPSLTELDLTEMWFEPGSLGRLLAKAPLRALRLSADALGDDVTQLPALEDLGLAGMKLEPAATVARLKQVAGLRRLELWASGKPFPLHELPLDTLEVRGPAAQTGADWRGHALRSLTLYESTQPGLGGMLQELKELRELTLHDCRVEEDAVFDLPNLERLAITSGRQGTLRQLFAAQAGRLRALVARSVALPESFAAAPELETLEIRACGIEQAPALTSVFGLTRLRRLTLEWAANRPLPGEALAGLGGLSALESLTLSGDLGDAAAERLVATLAALPRLRELSLPRCGIRLLPRNLASLERLERLDLGFNELTAEDTQWIRRALPNTDVKLSKQPS